MAINLRIRSVDMNGFLGRENHPEPEMKGEVVRLVGVSVEPPADWELEDGEERLDVYTCRRADGSLVDLMEFEVEVVDTKAERFIREVAEETCSTGDPREDQSQLDILRDKAVNLLGGK